MYQEEGSSAHLVSIASCIQGHSTCPNDMMIMSLLTKSDVQILFFFLQSLAVTGVWEFPTI